MFPLQPAEASTEVPPPKKKPAPGGGAAKDGPAEGTSRAKENTDRLSLLEAELKELKAAQGQETVDQALSQVRVLALRSTTSNAVLLAGMETLSDTAYKVGHKHAEHYKMCLKACKEHEGDGKLQGLVTKLVGSEEAKKVNASLDAWRKALRKEDKKDKEKKGQDKDVDKFPTVPDWIQPLMWSTMMGGASQAAGPWVSGRGCGRYRGRGFLHNRGRYGYADQGKCYACQSTEHRVKDCPKTKNEPKQE